jgi:glycosyltransferase involved in cell wall biosynthesis
MDYQQRYPEVIHVIYSDANVGASRNGARIFARARGDFVAYCEGDDYWCTPDKLARQVALIKDDPSISIVHGDWIRLHKRGAAWRIDPRGSVHRSVRMSFLQGDVFDTWYLPKILRTCTVLLRRQTVQDLIDSGLARREYKFGDSVLNVFATGRGGVAYVPEIIAVYRVSPNSALRSGASARVAFYKSCLEFDDDALAYFTAQDREYGAGYRWEANMSLLLWALRAKDVRSAWFAIKDMIGHFGVLQFATLGWKSVRMRLPMLRHWTRTFPIDPGKSPTRVVQ